MCKLTGTDTHIWVCPVCQRRITQLMRVGHLLLAEPCTHAVLDLQTQAWYRRQEPPAHRPRRPRPAVATGESEHSIHGSE